ncbi:pre-mRNA-splicing factor ATP-dependent RNA helicase PRP16 [Plasmodium sp. gorilla clade G2]|uniref:pre-mRNA-splicing factor ATP-dependent RNA helicase PRP16 n=1 Tax=Plasmodium sp. gorilla clade G2 TaxID=880535 RepID=UPI000D20D22C|nr:pre-mRNA-splicing factor ATP-dependent RNA helicase PRP16 [Plasmodium sp. gorilla clade G2]SOV18462.1 pre-mRNA-splicing factor ATP-dependent RNA helicase PRP16 [Plasmodium sp. gorilla clade G2]
MIAKSYFYSGSSSDDNKKNKNENIQKGFISNEKKNEKTLEFKRRKVNKINKKLTTDDVKSNIFKKIDMSEEASFKKDKVSKRYHNNNEKEKYYKDKIKIKTNSIKDNHVNKKYNIYNSSTSTDNSDIDYLYDHKENKKNEKHNKSDNSENSINISINIKNDESNKYNLSNKQYYNRNSNKNFEKDEKKKKEYYKKNNDKILDEIWYTKEDEFVDSFYNMDIEATYEKEKKMINNIKSRINSNTGKKVNQKNLDNNLWELNKLKQGGVTSTYNKLQLEKINEANVTNEIKKIVLTRTVNPPFIDKFKSYNKRIGNIEQRDNFDYQKSEKKKSDNINNDKYYSNKHIHSTSYSTVVKDETCDFVKAAKKGSEFLKYFKSENEKSEARDRYWEISNSKLGELLKLYKNKKKNINKNINKNDNTSRGDNDNVSNNSFESNNEDDNNSDVFDYKKDKMYSSIFNMDNTNKDKKNTLKDKEDLLKLKESLPIYKSKHELLDAVYNNNIIIIVGETGSGKTTQIVQYLYEEGYHRNGIICCTQPRRVAAVSVAYRVSYEMNVDIGSLVGYTIRFEDNTTKDTKIRYVTDGILLRETLNDKELDKYSVIIMDEAHERSINTDVLLGILKNICLKRNDLKLIVTSATIDAKKFSQFFGNAPIYNIEGRTFKVHIEYLRTPCNDYIECAVQKAIQIHVSDNNYDNNFGDILIFMTGQEDINATCYLLSERFYEVYESYKESKNNKKDTINKIKNILNEDKNNNNNNNNSNIRKNGDGDNNTNDHIIYPFYIFPIYSQLSSEQQSKIFKKYDLRKIIVSTNIAETSLTLDGIKYVIDTGYCKLKVYNQNIGMDVLQVTPISQANANQRSGRAGRTGAGICYRLYTENTFLCDLYQNNIPEIQRSNLSNVVLLLKSLHVQNLFEFDFIDVPSKESIINSLQELWVLGAINNEGNLTEIGRKMVQFPLDPPLSKIVIYSEKFQCTKEILIIVSMLSSPSIFLESKENNESIESKKEKFTVPESDHLTLLNIYLQWRSHNYSYSWCTKNFIQYKALNKAKEVYSQLIDIIKTLNIKNVSCDNKWELIRKTICSGYFHNAAKLKSFSEYINLRTNVSCHVHPNSSLYNIGYTPDYVIYQEIVFTTKEYMRNVTTVDPEWLCELGPLFFYMKNL